WLAKYSGNQNSRGEKFFTFKNMDKGAGVDYYLGYNSPYSGQPVIPRTTGDEWLPSQLGAGAMYM
ncbi:hypothetical protein H0H92_014414, partial [Tricholoma furcatifolium]